MDTKSGFFRNIYSDYQSLREDVKPLAFRVTQAAGQWRGDDRQRWNKADKQKYFITSYPQRFPSMKGDIQ